MKNKCFFWFLICPLLVYSCTSNDKTGDIEADSVTEEMDTVKPVVPIPEQKKLSAHHIVKRQTVHNGNVTHVIWYNPDGTIQKESAPDGNFLVEYTYDKKGELVKEYCPGTKRTRLYEYNNKGALIRKYTQETEQGNTILLFDDYYHYSNGKLVSVDHIDHHLKYIEKTKYRYNEYGNIEQENVYFKSDSVVNHKSETSTYNYQGGTQLMWRKIWCSYDENGKESQSAETEFEYDKVGNLTKRTNRALGIVQTYLYEYNDKGLLSKETMINPQNRLIRTYNTSVNSNL